MPGRTDRRETETGPRSTAADLLLSCKTSRKIDIHAVLLRRGRPETYRIAEIQRPRKHRGSRSEIYPIDWEFKAIIHNECRRAERQTALRSNGR